MKYRAWFDGSAKPNPGEMTIGGYIIDENEKIIEKFSHVLGEGTNNRAEYLALVHLTAQIRILGIKDIDIKGDSNLVVQQVNGNWKCRDQYLKQLRDNILTSLRGVNWTLEHVYRENNKEADLLTR
jgi:ribonuclease HI